eukprot:1023178-Alexandrium_andersonii.AAC.1
MDRRDVNDPLDAKHDDLILPIPTCALACVLFAMTTADSKPSISDVRMPGAMLKASAALKGGRSFQNAQTNWGPPPIAEDGFQ